MLEAVGALERIAFAIAGGVPTPRADLSALLEFFQRFVEGAHHDKEERALLPAIERECGTAEGAFLARLVAEHEEGRRLLAELMAIAAVASDDVRSRATLVRAAVAYASVLRAYLHDEEERLFPLALRVLGRGRAEALRSAFARLEAEVLPAGARATVVASVRCLAARAFPLLAERGRLELSLLVQSATAVIAASSESRAASAAAGDGRRRPHARLRARASRLPHRRG